ncbi:MAG TPA: hypothetical protein VJU83_01090 [Burkholderiales bacterium]|nr:hypothetical protein [Burkholderiales bacterium]
MKRTAIAALAALGLIALTGCDRENDNASPQSSMEGSGSTGGSATYSGSATSPGASGDMSSQTGSTTQQQLDPIPSSSGSATSGSTSP